MSEKKAPAHTIAGFVGDGLKLKIWENQSNDGRVWYNATLTRSYRDQSGQWHDTSSIDQRDLLEVAEMYRDAHAWVKQQARARATQQRQEAGQDTPQAANQSEAAEQPGYAERETQRKRAGRTHG
jgi:hypothetical protein